MDYSAIGSRAPAGIAANCELSQAQGFVARHSLILLEPVSVLRLKLRRVESWAVMHLVDVLQLFLVLRRDDARGGRNSGDLV